MEKTLTPLEEQRNHEAAILATLAQPQWRNIPAGDLTLLPYINDLESASESRWTLYRNTWSPALVGALVVVMVDGRPCIIDGRHRWLAIRAQGFMFHCAVHENLTVEQIVALFLFHNQYRRNPSATEKFRAAVASGDPIALTVQKAISIRGVNNELRAYSAAQQVIKEANSLLDGEQALTFSIRALSSAFAATDRNRLDGALLRVCGRFFRAHGGNPKLSEERFVKALNDDGRRTAINLKNAAGGTNSVVAALFRILENDYAKWSGGHRL